MRRAASSLSSAPAALDRQQELLLEEMCLLVDERDHQVGAATKRRCHQWADGSCPLHRAFSVFLFDSRDRLLLQQRSDVKVGPSPSPGSGQRPAASRKAISRHVPGSQLPFSLVPDTDQMRRVHQLFLL